MKEYMVLDVETQRMSYEVAGGWNRVEDFGLSIAVTKERSRFGDMVIYYKDEKVVDEIWHTKPDGEKQAILTASVLVEQLRQASYIITFNGIRFDYEVLRPYGLQPELLYEKSYDILAEFYKAQGHRISLDNLATATLPLQKKGHGLDAVTWFKQGKIAEIIKYCQQDVEVTLQLYEFIKKHGFVNYTSRDGRILSCQLKA